MINDIVKNKYIRATSDEHGARIIKFLVENGGRNDANWGGESGYYYFIGDDGVIDWAFLYQDISEGYTEMHLPEDLKRGDMVEVSDAKVVWEKRIFITEINGSEYPFVCVSKSSESVFHLGKTFDVKVWKHCRKVSTITREEAEKQLGKKILG